MVDDAELLRRYTETHSEPAFTEFVGRHLNLVYFTALRGTHGDTALAHDVTQAVFTVAARRARTLIAHPTLAGWLHTTTRHTADRARQKERTRQHYQQKAALHDMITGGSDYEWERLRPVIDEALDELEPREREAILVRFFESRPFADMGAAWQISQDAARMRVDRALEKLRVALESRGVRSVSAALSTVLTAQGGLAAPVGMVSTVSGTALTAAVASGGMATFFSIMSGTKIIIGTAVAIIALATGTAVFNHNRAATAELRLDAATRELVAARAQLARSEQRRSSAETTAAEAEKDSGALLAAVEAARAKAAMSPRSPLPSSSSQTSSPNDPLAQTLHPLFPNGIVATLGDRVITVDDVRREITPLLAKVQQNSANPDELRQRLYALQNSVISDLVTRQLDIKEFHNPIEIEAPKHIPSEMIDNAIADRVKDKFNNDQPSFLASLNAQGLTLAQYRQTVEEDIEYAYMRSQQRRLAPAKDGQIKAPSP
jgi:RNA polymerase sigma factor (sigma-70 family)